jgi:ribonuclease I
METCCPNIESGRNNMFFWGHEWYAHGTCSNLDKRGYFNLAFHLYKDNNIGLIFKVNFIRPGAISRSEEMVTALKAHTKGKEVQLICDNDGKLKEVILCVEKHEPFNHVNCPVKVHCPEFVNYPPVIANEEL